MQRLQRFPLKEPRKIGALRQKCTALPSDVAAQIALGVALSNAGCTYEAAAILRPLRAQWKSTDAADDAGRALEAQTWWNKNWRDFAQHKRAGNKDAALNLLSDRAVSYWDLPGLLVHLGDIAAHDGQLDLARHLYQRVFDLSQRGLPKMNMTAFAYVAQAALADVLARSGKPAEALAHHLSITPSPGNAMAHEIQHANLLVAAGTLDQAMQQVAKTLVTAEKHRAGYSKVIRLEFVETAPELAPLRERPDWNEMLNDPASYLSGR